MPISNHNSSFFKLRKLATAFYYEPFKTVDAIEIDVWIFHLNLFQKYKRLRRMGLVLALIALGCWIAFGFDSAVGQIMHFLYATPQYLAGSINLNEWIQVFVDSYGTELRSRL